MTTIDVHAHILPRSATRAHDEGRDWFGTTISRNAEGRTVLVTGSRRNAMSTPEYWLDHEDRIPLMDEAEVDIQVLSLNPQLFRDSDPLDVAIEATRVVNDEIAETVTKRPDRFRGLGVVPLQDPDAGIAELERLMGDLKLCGVIVGSHVGGRNWDDPGLFPILQAAARLGAFILLHPFSTRVGTIMPNFHLTNLIGNPMETTVAAASLIFSGAMERLPNLKICLSHAGGYLPAAIGRFDHGWEERPEARKTCPRMPSDYLRSFYYDCITHSDTGFGQVIDIVGTDRILLGTDFPADMGVRRPVTWLAGQSYLSDADRAAIGGTNAAPLIGYAA